MNGAMTFFSNFDQNNSFEGIYGTLKIRLLQCYAVLWIHNIDAICIEGMLFTLNFWKTSKKIVSNLITLLLVPFDSKFVNNENNIEPLKIRKKSKAMKDWFRGIQSLPIFTQNVPKKWKDYGYKHYKYLGGFFKKYFV